MEKEAGIQFVAQKQTGRLMFKFDNDEPHEIGPIYDHGKFTIELKQHDPSKIVNNTFIEFTSREGKRLRLYVEGINQK